VCDIVWGVGLCVSGRVNVQGLRMCDIVWGVDLCEGKGGVCNGRDGLLQLTV